MKIPKFKANEPVSEITQALEISGCVVVTDVMSDETRQSIKDDMQAHLDAAKIIEDDDPNEFYPGNTRRVTGLVARSPAITCELLNHPISKSVCETHLLPNSEFGYQLHVSAVLEVGPGARGQTLHREEDSFTFFPLPRPNMIVASMWAVSDFRKDNGATLLVPGSHKWAEDRVPEEDEIVNAEMPAGSVLYWMGGLLHGAGENTSSDWRYGVILTYSLGWLRQEENQYLNVPRERLKQLTPEEKRTVGFDMYRALGLFDPSI